MLPMQARLSYPAEVEDIFEAHRDQSSLSESVSAVGVSGYAVVAAARDARAHLFALMGGHGTGSSRNVLSLPLPFPGSGMQPRPPKLAIWNASATTQGRVAIAALDATGSLRFYSSVSINTRETTRPQELRVSRALALSARIEEESAVQALDLVRAKSSDGRDNLFVFGGHGSAAIVRLGEFSPSVEPLEKVDPTAESRMRTSITFGRLFHAALRSIGGETRPNHADFETGTGECEIVGRGALKSTLAACVARQGGGFELWGTEHLLWSLDVFELAKSRTAAKDRRIISASITTDDTAVCLLEECIDDVFRHRVVGFFVSRTVPDSFDLEIELGDMCGTQRGVIVSMAVSEGIAYFHLPGTNILQWLSVSRGIAETDQVRGCVTLGEGVEILQLMDASHPSSSSSGLDAGSGGIVACLCSDAVRMVSSGVPAPLSMQRVEEVANPEEQNVTTLLWIAQLQFSAGQIGASRASLRAFYHSTFVNDAPSPGILGEVVLDTCQRIISSEVDPNSQPVALLVDSELEKRQNFYICFIRLLGDSEVFAGIRTDARTLTEDRLWDALPPDVRHGVLSLGEKLSAAIAIRRVENTYISGASSMRYRDPTATSIIGSEVHGTRTGSDVHSIFGEGLREMEEQFTGGASIVALALQSAGTKAGTASTSADQSSFLYRFPLHFHLFLSALRDCLVDVFSRARQPQEMDSFSSNSLQRALRAMTILACDAAVAVTQAARETRSATMAQLERDAHILRSFDEWTCTETSRSALELFVDSALERCAGGRQYEVDALQRRAATVTDELLACTCRALSDAELSPSVSGMNFASAPKRRRIVDGDDRTPWGRARSRAMEKLRGARLTEDSLRLAEKYRDFGTIMALQTQEDDLDAYFERAVEKFGDDFAFYAFRWLEDQGEIKLLLKGRGSLSANVRSERINSLLATYFREERAGYSNLEWMLWLTTNDGARATRALCEQTRAVDVPGRVNSLESSKVLASIAKLSLIASGSQLIVESADSLNQAEILVRGVLERNKIQSMLTREQVENEPVLEPHELVFRYLDQAPDDSARLAEHVTIALETLKLSNLSHVNGKQVEREVWRRCVDREEHLWRAAMAGAHQMSDSELRSRLMSTAFFSAATRTDLDMAQFKLMAADGVFNMNWSIGQDAGKQLLGVVLETAKLAVKSR